MAYEDAGRYRTDRDAAQAVGERVSDVRARPAGHRLQKPVDPGSPSIERPAHPLPATRSSSLDYDRYLQRATDKFQIFSASERRARRKKVVAACACVVILAVLIIWVAISRMA